MLYLAVMLRKPLSILLFCLPVVVGAVFFLSNRAPDAKKIAAMEAQQVVDDFHAQVEPLLSTYCYECHDDEVQKGDLNLARFESPEMILAERRQWEDVLENVSMHVMPPLKKTQPSADEREVMASWIDGLLYRFDAENPDPGRVTLRRLNRTEYNNTIRDLLHVDFSPADDFPADDTGYGFDNNGDVLTLSAMLMEKYLAAAEQVLDKVFESPARKKKIQVIELNRFRAPRARVTLDDISFSRNGEAAIRYTFKQRGKYILRVQAWATQAGAEKAKMAVLSPDGREKVVTITGTRNSPETVEIPFVMEKEKGRIAVEFINDFWDPENPRKDRRDRNLTVSVVSIEGPLGKKATPSNPAKDKLYACLPAGAARDDRSAARTIIESIGSRAYRRPISSEEEADLLALYDIPRREGGSFEDGLKMSLTAMLVTSRFLFRGAAHPDPDNPDSVQLVSETTLASRLSYFLWSSMPDDTLLELAEQGGLRAQLDEQVLRMLRDPKASALTDNFAGQWLQFRDMDLITPDPEIFPTFSDPLRRAMKEETRLCFQHIVKNDRSILELLQADYSFLNEPLALHYGMTEVKGLNMRLVSPLARGRGGILRHASVLAITSNPDRTSPVKRGKWVLENILGTPPPPAPEDVPALESNESIKEGMSFREQLELHAEDPVCASCHAIMDPIGLAFEHYDALGRWREDDKGARIDPSGKLKTGESFENAEDLVHMLAHDKADLFVSCMAERMLTYALGRGVEYYDRPAVERISEVAKFRNYRFASLVMAVVTSVPFQKQRGDHFEP